jgi:hypothetical protein
VVTETEIELRVPPVLLVKVEVCVAADAPCTVALKTSLETERVCAKVNPQSAQVRQTRSNADRKNRQTKLLTDFLISFFLLFRICEICGLCGFHL